MDSIEKRVDEKIKVAMKEKDKLTLNTLRMLKSSFSVAKTEKGSNGQLDPQKEIQIVNKLIKQRKESAEIYANAGRDGAAEEEFAQASILEEFAPEQLNEEEVEKEIDQIIDQISASSIKDMGNVMKEANSRMAGKADNKLIGQIAKRKLEEKNSQ